jgi:cytochrome c553
MTTKASKFIGRGAFVAAFLVLSVWIFVGPPRALAADEGETAPAAGGAAAPAAEGAAAAIDSAALWGKNCKSCHGEDGKGDTKAGKMKHVKDLTNAEVRAGFDRARMLKSVADGMKDEAGKVLMKPYSEKLSAEEIAALTDYVFALPH